MKMTELVLSGITIAIAGAGIGMYTKKAYGLGVKIWTKKFWLTSYKKLNSVGN